MFNVQVGALKNKNKHPLKVREPLLQMNAGRSSQQKPQKTAERRGG